MRHVFRYLVDAVPDGDAPIALASDDAHHLVRVVRRGVGDAVELIDPVGTRWPAEVVEAGERALVRVVGPGRPAPPGGPRLYQGLTEWPRLDLLAEKAVELGAGGLTLFTSARSGRVPAAEAWERRRARLERVIEAAARQCGRAPLGRVAGLVPFAQVMSDTRSGEGFLIDPRGDVPLLSALAGVRRGADIALVVGPAAGFSPAEVEQARAGGLAVCTLGPTILRSETAALAALALAGARAEAAG